jgi:fatty acid CoA ligase FadD9
VYASDPQFAAARPDEAVSAAIERPGLRLPQLVQTVMDGYADRPALGQRAVEYVTDTVTGRTSAQLLPRFETVTYGQVWKRIGAFAAALANDRVKPGDRVATLGFTSVDYAVIDTALTQIGAVSVPLQTSAPVAQLLPIVTETEPTVIASSIDYLGDAVELALTGHTPARLVVFAGRRRDAGRGHRTRAGLAGTGVRC